MSRAPVRIVAVEPDADSFLIVGGRRYAGVNVSVSKETFEAMLEGYVCALCYERQDEPFPVKCKAEWCPMEMRAKQRELLEQLYQGERWIGPRTSDADELERMDEESIRRRHVNRSRILLPPKN
jgi:hypothetical protein